MLLTGKQLKYRKPLLTIVLLLTLIILFPLAANAHPLGNFTINRYSRLMVNTEQILLTYIVDIAEIPAMQEFERIDQDGDQLFSQAEQDAYLNQQVYAISENLHLQVNGTWLAFTPQKAKVTFPEGQGGLMTVRLEAVLQALLPNDTAIWQADYVDQNYPERTLGWQEIVVQAEDGVTLLESTVPSEDLTQTLQHYPEDRLMTPLQVNQASFRFEPAVMARSEASQSNPVSVAVPILSETEEVVQSSTTIRDDEVQPQSSFLSQTSDPFSDLMTVPISGLGGVLLALAAAFGWGAMHAFSPGHGKTVVAAYLVGSRGTARHALFLGLTTTITHTAGVFLLGAVTLFVSYYILPETLYPWLGVASGLLVVILGLSIIPDRLRRLKGDHHHHNHDHEHHHHHHDHDHFHDHDHTHSHLPPGAEDASVTWRSLLALGISGGLVPCPSALIVMLSAIALGRIGFGLILILAFSIGLAGVLTATGLAFVFAGRLFERVPVKRLPMQALPLLSALVITVIGLGITGQALLQTGVISAKLF
ncbi:MAG: sulfite exporter TauE/SafE family protein [Chloroflexota bacterium]